MKTTTLALAALAAALALPPAAAAQSYWPRWGETPTEALVRRLTQPRQLLPNLYASRFCELRSVGVSYDEAMAAAMRESVIDADVEPPKVKLSDGTLIGSDVALAFITTQRRCAWAMK
jgi:hypothetical protein